MKKYFLSLLLMLGLLNVSRAQIANQYEEQILKFENPSVPGYLIIEQTNGKVNIITHKANTINFKADFMPHVEQANNAIRITGENTQWLSLQIPELTSIKVKIVKDGECFVQGAQRAVEVQQGSGNIRLENLEGWAVVYTGKGKIEAEFVEVFPNKPMSFVNFEGDIDLQFPASLEANFDITSPQTPAQNAFVNSPQLLEKKQVNTTEEIMTIQGNPKRTKNLSSGTMNKPATHSEMEDQVGAYKFPSNTNFNTQTRQQILPLYQISTREGRVIINHSKSPKH